MILRRLLPLSALVVSLCACATTEGEFPSLARRDAERVTGTLEAPASPAVAPGVADPDTAMSPQLSARLEQIEARARAGHARFLERESRARASVAAARDDAVASEQWSVATIAVAELEAARSQVMIALADLDSLYAADRIAGGDSAAIALVRARVTALVMREDAVLASLGRALRE